MHYYCYVFAKLMIFSVVDEKNYDQYSLLIRIWFRSGAN